MTTPCGNIAKVLSVRRDNSCVSASRNREGILRHGFVVREHERLRISRSRGSGSPGENEALQGRTIRRSASAAQLSKRIAVGTNH